MIEITMAAREKIRDIADRERTSLPIRIMPAGGCTACRLGMLFDSRRKDDEIFKIEGVRYVINGDLLSRLQSVTVDYAAPPDGSGFFISSRRELDSLVIR